MGYQALLFCPDEKTARTVTQVLSELDFTVVPCTEPFAAVKKLMGEHFDAVVVDCDNEQNATLLLKSARNAPNNQSALAVAVVEGQAGVAKAFRIGANLVLTKPINVEQAKGTLRVARGLLRKSESAKPATAAAKPAVVAPGAAAGPVLVSSTPPVSAVSPVASAPIQKPVAQPSFAASASSVRPESDDSAREVTPPRIVEASAPEAKPEVTFSKQVTSASSSVGSSIVTSAGAASSGAASAAAPAREAAASVAAQEKLLPAVAEPEVPVEQNVGLESPAAEGSASAAPSFTFGGAVEAGDKPAGGSKKTLIAVAALVVIAAGGYFAWTQFGPSQGTATVSAPVAARPAATAPVPQAAPSAVATTPDASSSAAASATATAVPTTAAQTAKVAKPVPAPTAPGATQTHANKASPLVDSSKTVAAVVADSKAPATSEVSQPIVVRKSATQTAAGKTSSTSDAPAPSITGIAAAGDGGTLPNLLSGSNGAPAPVLQTLNISQGVSQGLILKKISPSYPSNALRMRIEGSVELLATISKKGDISAVKILSGDPNLARAAADAVKQWKYKPYLLDGSPVEIQTQVTVNFKLPR